MFLNKGINVLSLFDGMSCGRLALSRAGIAVDNYYASEIDKHAIKVSKQHWCNEQLGDVTQWENWKIDWSSVDLILAGSPCQGFSFAGKQLAFDDPRSKLFFVFLDILSYIQYMNPNVKFLLENVKMKKNYLQLITDKLGVNPVLINSSLVSAQNRQRYYWCNWDVEQPTDRGFTWGDVREYNVSIENFYYGKKAVNWLINHSQRKNKPLKIHLNNEKMQMIEASHCKKYSSQRFFGICDIPESDEVVAAMRSQYLINGKRQDESQKTAGLTQQCTEFRYDGKTNALATVRKDNVAVPFTLPNRIPVEDFFFRYITPIECERLQTVPDNYTALVSNTQRYKMLGNGWTVDVIKHILEAMPQ